MEKARILITEDDSIIGMDIQNTLRNLGYDVQEVVTSGEEAIRKAEELKPDLILMDIILSGKIDGIEAVKQIKERHDIPVIYLTAHTENVTFERAIETKPYGYLVKPVGRNDLYTAVETALNRHDLERELRESEERYRNIIENSTNLFYAHTCNHVLTYLSPQVKDILGYKPEEAMIKWTKLASDNPINDKGIEITQKAIDTGETQQPYELELISKKGKKVWLEIHESPIVVDGKAVSIVGTATDITERKRAEEALMESEERYRLIYDYTGEAIYTFDRELKLIGLNRMAIEIIGYDEEKIIGRNVLELGILHPDDVEIAMIDIERLFSGNRVVNNQYRFVKKDGSIAIGDVTGAALYNQKGEIIAITNVVRDITDRKQTEEELQEKMNELEIFYRATLGREERVIELKQEVNELLGQLGKKKKYGDHS